MPNIRRWFLSGVAVATALVRASAAGASGPVVGWGYPDYWPLAADGTYGTATAIAAGEYHSCAIQAGSGAVVCWGFTSYGRTEPPNSVNGTDGTAAAIAAGGSHSCAIRSGSGAVVCWGGDGDGQSIPPASVDGRLGKATAIAAGEYHSCAIRSGSGAVICWGDDSHQQATPPASVDGRAGAATAIAAGWYHSCAIQAGSNAVVCWGENDDREATPPAMVDGTLGTARAIATGNGHSCAIQAGSNAVVCWGDDDYGQAKPPASVDGRAGAATAIAVGDGHSCAIQAGSAAVVCWGNDTHGQATPPTSPDGVAFEATAIAAGGSQSLAIRQATPLERGDLLVTDHFGGRVVRVDPSGAVDTFSPPPGGRDLLVNPAGIVAAPDGDVYLVDSATHLLIRIDRETGAQSAVVCDSSEVNVGDQPWGIDVFDSQPVTGSFSPLREVYVSASDGLRIPQGRHVSCDGGELVDGTLPASHFGVAVRSDGHLDSVWIAAGAGGLWIWDAGDDAAIQVLPFGSEPPQPDREWFLDVDFLFGVPIFAKVVEAGFGGCAAGTGGVFTAGEGGVQALSQGGLLRCPFSLDYVPDQDEIYVADASSLLFGGEGRLVKLRRDGLSWEQSLFVDAATLGVSLPAGIVYVPENISDCAGDCNGNDAVVSGELILGVNIALGSATVYQCSAFDVNGDLQVTIDELLLGVGSALDDCPPPSV